MLSKCANPACSAPFRYLHQGRIFTMISGSEFSAIHAVWDHAVERPVERYWLCEVCAQTMTISRVNDHAVVRPLPSQRRAPSLPEVAA